MKRQKHLSKKERKSATGAGPRTVAKPAQAGHQHTHIHCIACGKHLDPDVFGEPDGADFIRCDHGSDFPHCVACYEKASALVKEHDRTGQPVAKAAMWH